MRAWVRGGLVGMCMVLSSGSWALGLGEITVESYLNQPLRATITLVNPPTDNLNTLTVGLASAADYDLVGLDRATLSVPLSFEVVEAARGPVVRVSSDRPVQEPVMRMLVEVVWANGRVLREYTVFLDPPTVASAAPAPRADRPPAQAPSEPQPSAASAAPAPESVERSSATTPSGPSVSQRVEDGEYGPVRRGETLWGIASEWSRGSGYTVNQVMLAIQQANPDAFNRGNINSLKRGAILRLPEDEAIRSISAREATAEVLVQAEAYELMRLGLASRTPTVAATPTARSGPEAASDATEDASGDEAGTTAPSDGVESGPGEDAAEAVPQVTDATESTSAEPAGRLELVPPVEASEQADAVEDTGSPTDAPLEEQLARAQEDLVNAEQQNEYLEQRLEELQSELETTRQAPAAVADTELAEMQQRLGEQRRAAAGDEDPPWYLSWWAWILLLLVLGGLGLWWYRRREQGDSGQLADALVAGGARAGARERHEPVKRIKDEAEEILRVLDSDEPPRQSEIGDETPSDDLADRLEEAEADAEPRPAATARPPEDDIEAHELQADDPEVKLDLARAYFAMGDKEAARSMLEEVLAVGSEEQQAEARTMLDEF